ncbi:glycoside hydrolase family 29 protein [Zopfia rhizophila CBS 207.26]|uniref:alpha-L-fucosidase n=1 Tax=Zopfia rhizophila CBS 207.26 TaxID=1314779 RepID=A0A6A6EQR7_9PEZI|nr:glycoside hydrolase family 29 protein [Zopfia rhizophila CBS 207.26]
MIAESPEISIVQANSSSRRTENSPGTQIFDVVLENTGEVWLVTSHDLKVTVQSEALITVQPAKVKRIRPGNSVVVEVGVENKHGVERGSTGTAKVVAQWANGASTSLNVTATYGIPKYNASKASIDKHESPNWWRNAKYGIFIHWGLYSVPAWGNTGPNESYAEWYWFRQINQTDKTQTYQYHLEHYGPNVVYDDFMANFTADKFNPKDWVDLFADAGARYFVQVTKHHDGYAIFDMPGNVSERNSVKQNPHRDFLKEIFEAARTYQPQLRRGTYFSMPEWFNPAYTEYTRDNKWGIGSEAKGPPINPYTNKTVPYTGFVEVGNFLQDIQLPQMNILAYDYDTEIMWCDIGGPSLSSEFASQWLNSAYAKNKQVTLNSRCGGITGDFTTPEYKPITNLSARHWEATRGLDPYSFGYNAATPDNQYMNASTVVRMLVDIVAKNGNFLLDVGPKSDGTIPDIMMANLRDAGKWINAHAESIFDTEYWPNGPGDGDFRYTTTGDAFYIHILRAPTGPILIPDPVPYLETDNVTVVGGLKHGTTVQAGLNSDGRMVLNLPNDFAEADDYVWTFKFTY